MRKLPRNVDWKRQHGCAHASFTRGCVFDTCDDCGAVRHVNLDDWHLCELCDTRGRSRAQLELEGVRQVDRLRLGAAFSTAERDARAKGKAPTEPPPADGERCPRCHRAKGSGHLPGCALEPGLPSPAPKRPR